MATPLLSFLIVGGGVINFSLRCLQESDSHWSRYLDMTSS